MNSLLIRQKRKYLDEKIQSDVSLNEFIKAVAKSYENYEEQIEMIRLAMKISSDELFEANEKLRDESDRQRKVIDNLQSAIKTLKKSGIKLTKRDSGAEVDLENLTELINVQAKEIVTSNNENEELLKNLEKQNEELNQYAHIVSHDLKSPLRSIDTIANWMLEDWKEEMSNECYEHINMILNNVQKMDSLINGIYKYSTINKKESLVYDVDTQLLVDELVKIIYVPNNITITIPNELPTIKGDKYRLQQLFQNLITNAIHFSDKPKGIIEVGFEDLDTNWQFYIKDNGIGIPQKYHKKIFGVFQKLDATTNSTGIGLSIVHKIIEYYGGEITLQSKDKEGTTFYFKLPK
ncbi:sensor histidine kinase [Tenacibaculum geojense]|uniref:histidine kinase n=1 Tax=Tenacibaculum geojense TaxID=915352 RepID=A0ABW3JRU6_9FLAO